jgi:hypothetical protein
MHHVYLVPEMSSKVFSWAILAHGLRQWIHHIANTLPHSSNVVATAVYSRSPEIRKFGLEELP